ncbi:hypothetical protein [Baekduia soli]|nr:hypothetical protein [Baekduia soli]
MADDGHELQFGVFLMPEAARAGAVLELGRSADMAGLDLARALKCLPAST